MTTAEIGFNTSSDDYPHFVVIEHLIHQVSSNYLLEGENWDEAGTYAAVRSDMFLISLGSDCAGVV
jgi:hypothetical protein